MYADNILKSERDRYRILLHDVIMYYRAYYCYEEKKCLNKNTKHNIWCAKARVEFYFIIMFRFTYSVRNQSLVFF